MLYAILLPLIAGVIGWFTNYIAIKMLFRPQKPVKIGFFTVQGIFPKRQSEVADRIGKMIAEELMSFEDIKERLQDPASMEELHNEIGLKVDDYLENTFPEKYRFMAMLLGKKTKEKIKADFLEEIEALAPIAIEKYIDGMKDNLDVEAIIADKIRNLSIPKLEQLIMGVLQKEFRFIELIGAFIGFLIGVLQVLIVQLGLLT